MSDWLLYVCSFFFFKQKTAYEVRISDWSSDVCSSDLVTGAYSIVSALDPRDGHELWKFDPKVARDTDRQGCCDVANRGVAAWNGKAYVGAYAGRLIGLEATTGKQEMGRASCRAGVCRIG